MPAVPRRPHRPILRWDPVSCDVLCLGTLVLDGIEDSSRVKYVAHANVLQELWLWPGIGLGWGPHHRREGVTLALNVLDRIIGHQPGETCHEWHAPLDCSPWAYRLAWQLWDDQLRSMSVWGGSICGELLRRWVADARSAWEGPGVDLLARTPIEVWPTWSMDAADLPTEQHAHRKEDLL